MMFHPCFGPGSPCPGEGIQCEGLQDGDEASEEGAEAEEVRSEMTGVAGFKDDWHMMIVTHSFFKLWWVYPFKSWGFNTPMLNFG